MLPSVGESKPPMRLRRLDLHEPEGPIKGDKGDEIALYDVKVKVNVMEHFYLLFAPLVDFAQVFNLNQGAQMSDLAPQRSARLHNGEVVRQRPISSIRRLFDRIHHRAFIGNRPPIAVEPLKPAHATAEHTQAFSRCANPKRGRDCNQMGVESIGKTHINRYMTFPNVKLNNRRRHSTAESGVHSVEL
jgi:hypothetical protein